MQTDNLFLRSHDGAERKRSLVGLLIFICAYWGVTLVVAVIAAVAVLGGVAGGQFGPMWGIHAGGIALMLAILGAATRTGIKSFGFGGPHAIRNFALGSLGGIGSLAAVLFAMNLLGVYSWGAVTASTAMLRASALSYFLVFMGVAFVEEAVWRGYALVQLSKLISFRPAALFLSLMFAAGHALNPGETAIGLLDCFAFGFLAAWSFRLTGSLWLALGLHFSWDFGETFVFGVPDSGFTVKDSLLHPMVHGPDWLTGGSAGPEGSVLTIISWGIMLFVVWIARQRRSGLGRQTVAV
jgi:membrane protease YdiL (CAAX protease family)